MKKKAMIKSRVVALLFGVLLVCFGVSDGYGSVCSEGTSVPPFLNAGVTPNLLLMIDNSASMYDLAYIGDAEYCYDDSYDPIAHIYSGFFDVDQWYVYDSSNDQFAANDAGATTICSSPSYRKTSDGNDDICLTLNADGTFSQFAAKGQFLNWAAVSKMDIEKEILTGGKYDSGNNALQMESRGCLNKSFIKKTTFDNGDSFTLSVRAEDAESGLYETQIELYPVTADGYDNTSCQLAVEEMQKESPNLGQTKVYIEDCIGTSSLPAKDPLLAAQAAFNQSVQTCWFINKQNEITVDVGDVSRIKNSCQGIYEDNGDPGVDPTGIVPEHTGYICYGDNDKIGALNEGYVGRCWDHDSVAWKANGGIESDGWVLGDTCVEEALIDFCGVIDVPPVVDPSDQVTGTGSDTAEYWNLPAILIDSAIFGQVGEPLIVLQGRLAISDSELPTGLIQKYSTDLRIGAMIFNYDGAASECNTTDPYVSYDCGDVGIRDGSKIITPIDIGVSHTSDLVTAINGIDAETWTPLSESMYNAIGYYRQDAGMQLDSGDFTIAPDPITNWCQSNNIMLITDGAPTADQNQDMFDFVGTLAYDLGGGTCDALDGSTYLDDLSKYAYEDIWVDRMETYPEGQEPRTVSTHIVAAGSLRGAVPVGDKCYPENLLTAAADSGGTELYQADDFSQLENALAAAFSNIRAGASAGSAASVISSSRGGEGAIYQAIFWPSKPSSDLNSTAEIKWAGEVHSLFIDASGFMYEDTDENRQLTSDDKRVIIYFDNATLVSKGCYATPVNGTCSDSVDMDAIHYLWSAADWLAKISNSTFTPFDVDDEYLNRSSYISNARRRYIFTWNDLNNDGIVVDAEVLPFIGWNSSSETTGTDWVNMSTSGRRSVPNDFNIADDEVANDNVNNIVAWIRGVEVDGSRSRTIAKKMAGISPDPEVVWRLGDVIHSTPTAVSRPMENLHLLYQDTSYAKFVGRWANRRSMVYFGANDGMLHAVNAGFYKEGEGKFCLTSDCSDASLAPELGAEMWAYVPYNLLPHLRCLTDSDYNNAHKYYVDQVPKVFDARIFAEELVCATDTRDPDCIHPHGWGTVLVGSMRFGGAPVAAKDLSGSPVTPDDDERVFTSSYFVLDITNPEAPPVLLGELTRGANGVNMGFTTASPTPVVMKSDSGAGEWYLTMGSGPQAANPSDAIKGLSEQQPKVAVFPLEGLTTAKIPFRIPDAKPTSTSKAGVFTLTDSANGFVSDMITVDYDLNPNYMTDAVYFGTVEHGTASLPFAVGETYDDLWDGQLYRLVMRGIDADNEQVPTTPDKWKPVSLVDVGQPITAAPSVGTDLNRYWIYFGTGRFFDADIDKLDDAQQSFYGVKEPIDCTDGTFAWGTVAKGELYDVSDISVSESSAPDANLTGGTITGLNSLINYIAGSPGSCSTDAVDGWYRDFSRDRERNIGQATLLGGLLTFTTYQPYSDPCLQDGQAYLYGLHYQSGTSSYKSVFGDQGLDGDRVRESISIGRGLATTPNLHVGKDSATGDPTAFVQTSTGEIIELPQTNLPNSDFKTGRRGWLER